MYNNNKIPFAIQTSTGAIVSVDQVERGLQCGCRCPSCNGRLVARKGVKNEHCFAHYDESSEDCELAFETSIRLMLLSKLDALHFISTPAHCIPFDGELRQVTAARSDISVRSVPQASSHSSPAGLFQLMEKQDWYLALHFPAVNDLMSPVWLEQFVGQHPNTGVLSVRYSHFQKHLYGSPRPQGMDTINWLLTILAQSNDCLGWIYYPGEARALQKLQAEADRQLAERLEREHQAAERCVQERQAKEEAERQRRIEMEQLREQQQERAQQTQIAIHTGGPSPSQLQVSKSWVPCKHCHLGTPVLDNEGYCSRQFCVQSRQQGLSLPWAARSRYQYGKEGHTQRSCNADTWWSQSMTTLAGEEPKTRMCRYCGGSMWMGPNGWWCDHCEDK